LLVFLNLSSDIRRLENKIRNINFFCMKISLHFEALL
jgi:hypothetical protein